MTGYIEIQEIDHRTKTHTVNHVANGSSRYHCQGRAIEWMIFPHPVPGNGQEHKGNTGKTEKEIMPPGSIHSRQKAKGRPLIGEVGETEKARYYLQRVVQMETVYNQHFAKLVQYNHQNQ